MKTYWFLCRYKLFLFGMVVKIATADLTAIR